MVLKVITVSITHLDAVSEPLLHCLLELWGEIVVDWVGARIRTGGWRRPQLDGRPLLGQLQETGSHITDTQSQGRLEDNMNKTQDK